MSFETVGTYTCTDVASAQVAGGTGTQRLFGKDSLFAKEGKLVRSYTFNVAFRCLQGALRR